MNVILSQFFIFFIFTSISLHLQAQSTCQRLFENNRKFLETQIGEQQEQLLFRRMYAFAERLKASKFFSRQFELKSFDLPAPELVPTVQLMMEHITPIVERLLRPGVLESYYRRNDDYWRPNTQEVQKAIQNIYRDGQELLKKASSNNDNVPFNQVFSFVVRAISIYDFMPESQLILDMKGNERIEVQPNRGFPLRLTFNEYVKYRYLNATERLLKRQKHPFMERESKDGTVYEFHLMSALSLPFFLVGKPFESRSQVFAERFSMNLISVLSGTHDKMSSSEFFDHDLLLHFSGRSADMSYKTYGGTQIHKDSVYSSPTIGTIPEVYHQQQAFVDFLMSKIQEAYSKDPTQYAEYWQLTEILFHERGTPPHPIFLMDGNIYKEGSRIGEPSVITEYYAKDPAFVERYHQNFLFYRQIAIWTAEYLSQDPQHKKLSETILNTVEQRGTSLQLDTL